MARMLFFIALIAAVGTVIAEESAEVKDSVRSPHYPPYPPKPFKCPCKCFVGYKIGKAAKQCHKKKFLYKCAVLPCKKKVYYKEVEGKWCCDKPSPPPKPSRTPKPSPKCPCKCIKKKKAIHECYYLPHCKVIPCKKEHYGYSYKPQYQCCFPPKY